MIRHNGLDLLRICATCMVILIHIGDNLFGGFHIEIGKLCSTMSRPAVPLFLMLTGAFAFNKKIENRFFFNKFFNKIGIHIIIVSLFYMFYIAVSHNNLNYDVLKLIFINLLKGQPFYHLWYMYMLIMLYVAIPYIYLIIINLKEKEFNYFMTFWVFFGIISQYTIIFQTHWMGEFLAFIGYVLIGYKLKNFTFIKQKSTHICIILIILGFICNIISYNLFFLFNTIPLDIADKLFFTQFSPLIFIGGCLIFLGFSNLKMNISFSFLSNKTYYIYLFHAFYLDIMLKILHKYDSWIHIPSSLVIIVLLMIVLLCSYITSILYEKIYKFFRKA